jgi:nicotinamide mononucleotide (NMN) deamidase PncC
MKISTLFLLTSTALTASAFVIPEDKAVSDAGEDPANWVTFTKRLPEKTIVVTKYLGTEPLTGTKYATKTLVNKYNGQEVTRIVTGLAEITEAAKEVKAADNQDNWVTYTKELKDKTITVTRYMGEEPLTGAAYTTKTINHGGHVELVTAKAEATGVVAAADNQDNWVTYTKELKDKTITVTRYLGEEPLTGAAYTTKTINHGGHVELVTAKAEATGVVAAADNQDNWVTYTKELKDKTITVTRYLGEEPLTGAAYTTKTVNHNGHVELVTAKAQVTDAPVAVEKHQGGWVTYTKELKDKTITVTRYLGEEPLTGAQYTTKTIAHGEHVEVITAMADVAEQPEEISASAPPSLVLQWVHSFMAWI